MQTLPSKTRWSISERQRVFSIAVVLWIASLAISGPGVYVENHAVQVPLIRWLVDPSLYPGDPFIASLARYPSVLWRLVALAAKLVPLGPLLLTLDAVLRLAAIGAAGRLARAFAPGSRRAVVLSMALFAFVIVPFLGGGTIVESYFEQTGVAVALLLLAIAAYYEERRIACGVWLGLAFNANPLYVVFAASYLGAVFLLDGDYRKAWRSWLPAGALFAALGSYAAVLMVKASGALHADDQLWLAATRSRCWSHLYPAEWDWGAFAQTAVLASLALVVVRTWTGVRTRLGRHVIIWTCLAALWLGTAFAAAYLFKWPPLLMLQPARALDLWLCFASIAILSSSALPAALGAVLVIWMPPGWPAAAAALMVPAVRRRLATFVTIWVIVVGLHHFVSRVVELGDLRSAMFSGPDEPVARIAAWARTHTAKNDVFLVNICDFPDWDQFRGLSERSIYTNWEEGTLIYWDPSFAGEWAQRLSDVGFDLRRDDEDGPEEALCRIYTALGDEDVRRLRQKYALRYWIIPEGHPSAYRAVFAHDGYKVLDLR